MAHSLEGAAGLGQAYVDFAKSASDVPAPALALIGTDGSILAWGDGCRRVLGYRPEEIVGRPVADLLVGQVEAEAWSPAQGAVGKRGNRQAAEAVVEARHRDGRVVRLTVEVVAVSAPSGVDGAGCWFVAVTGTPDGEPPGEGEAGFLDRSPLAVAVWDGEMRLLWLNRASREVMGFASEGDPGAAVLRVLRGFDRTILEPVMLGVLASREPVGDHVVRWVSPEVGREVVFSSSLFPLASGDGTPLGICSVSLDITPSWERERLALLSRAAQRIGTTLDVMTTAQELADMAVPALADYVAVDLAEAVPMGEEPLERMPEGDGLGIPVLRRAGMASIHEGVPEAPFPVGGVVYAVPGSPYLDVLSEGRSHLSPVLESGAGTWLDRDPVRRQRVEETGMHSLMMVPLRARGTVLGLAAFARNDNAAPFSWDDLLLAEELGVQASLSLDNARRYTRERTAALALQRSLLPEMLSGGAAMDLATRYLPSARHEGVGGDWMDAIELPRGRIALVIGDVVGHGIHAAATMGRLRTAVHTLAVLDQPPAEVLDNLNQVSAQLAPSDSWNTTGYPSIAGASCLYAVYDPADRVLTVARAGHPPPVLVTPDGRAGIPDTPVGPPIGTGTGPYESVDLEIPAGTLVALYTDGLVETREADIDAGLDRLTAALRDPPADLDDLCERTVAGMTARKPPEDDVALLVARTRAAGAPPA
ncbi:SpoIIE family protein phosphatase [Streptomyces sp. NPDC049040]|uniref:SpoIIE family protein phosphatase n=1 Tax=Streptomyces sp. NPDC049040 TaxID=3365593 RepID=UPI0037111435